MTSASPTFSLNPCPVFCPNFTFSISDQTPVIPKSFSGLCKPFHSQVPRSISWTRHCNGRRGFFDKATDNHTAPLDSCEYESSESFTFCPPSSVQITFIFECPLITSLIFTIEISTCLGHHFSDI